jgi:hypothetical protein
MGKDFFRTIGLKNVFSFENGKLIRLENEQFRNPFFKDFLVKSIFSFFGSVTFYTSTNLNMKNKIMLIRRFLLDFFQIGKKGEKDSFLPLEEIVFFWWLGQGFWMGIFSEESKAQK